MAPNLVQRCQSRLLNQSLSSSQENKPKNSGERTGCFGPFEKHFPEPKKITQKEPRKGFGLEKFSGLLENRHARSWYHGTHNSKESVPRLFKLPRQLLAHSTCQSTCILHIESVSKVRRIKFSDFIIILTNIVLSVIIAASQMKM